MVPFDENLAWFGSRMDVCADQALAACPKLNPFIEILATALVLSQASTRMFFEQPLQRVAFV